MIHSFLLIGQSNMAGRGYVTDVPKIENDRINVLTNGRFQLAFSPINPDRDVSGVNLAESFADAYSKEHDVDVGLIPCADGGTCLDQWAEDSLLFDSALYCAELASRTSRIVGVLWHQGEGDCSPLLYPYYEEKFLKIMEAFRRKLGLSKVPFILGGLGDFLSDCIYDDNLKNYTKINDTLMKIANENEMTGFASAKGLTANSDNLHFNAVSLREFGLRYYSEWKKFEDKIVADNKAVKYNDIRTKLERF